MKDIILEHLISLVFSVISIILLPLISNWIKSKIQNENLKAMISDVEQNVRTCVDYVEQVMVSKIKDTTEWDEDTQKQALQEAVSRVCDSILDSTKRTLEANQIDITDYITTHVEAYIQSKKQTAYTGSKLL